MHEGARFGRHASRPRDGAGTSGRGGDPRRGSGPVTGWHRYWVAGPWQRVDVPCCCASDVARVAARSGSRGWQRRAPTRRDRSGGRSSPPAGCPTRVPTAGGDSAGTRPAAIRSPVGCTSIDIGVSGVAESRRHEHREAGVDPAVELAFGAFRRRTGQRCARGVGCDPGSSTGIGNWLGTGTAPPASSLRPASPRRCRRRHRARPTAFETPIALQWNE